MIYTKDLVPILRFCRKTIYQWLRLYEQGGLEELVTIRQRAGIPLWITEQTK
ncbi:MAG: helix-turn-helix domain-containing protein [Flavobacteriaceae bacterium]|nr:helix-turn-helix domain-containing protein [Flavobacteriaceae bacterium]